MRLAVLSDIHGNLTALQAVLADLAAAGSPDQTWVLGDLAAFGEDPAGCIQTVRDLPEVKVIEGNTDRYLRTGVRPHMGKQTEESWPGYAAKIQARDQQLLWTLENIGWPEMEYLQKLGKELAQEVQGYGWLAAFHAIPGDDEGMILPDMPDHEVLDSLSDREGRLAMGGHTHLPMNRDLGRWRFINPGSVGMPFDGDNRAAYAILTFDGGALSVELRRVAYDIEGVVKRLESKGYPGWETLAARLHKGSRDA